MRIQRHHEDITFDVVGMAPHHIVLGMPWLKKHNLVIDWRKGVLTFRRTGDIASIRPVHQQRMVTDEKSSRKPVEACVASASNKDDLRMEGSDSLCTSNGLLGNKGIKQLFQEEKCAAALGS